MAWFLVKLLKKQLNESIVSTQESTDIKEQIPWGSKDTHSWGSREKTALVSMTTKQYI